MKYKIALLCGLITAGTGAARLVAQDTSPREESAEEAGKEFVAYLARQDMESLRNIVARDSFEQLGVGGVEALLRDLRLIPSRWETKNGEAGEVLVTPIFEAQPIICRKEGRFWRVDAIATAWRWKKLDATSGVRTIVRDYSQLPRFGPESRVLCLSNLQAIAVALKQYQQDNNDFFPPSERWTDSLLPYVRNTKVFHCPAAGKQSHGYSLNENLAQMKRSEVALRTTQVPMAIIYESNELRSNASGGGQNLAYRHEKIGHALLTDGTVRPLFQGIRPHFQLPPKTLPSALPLKTKK
jgi:hypothetical protein